jgi:hypothetical protein
MVGRGLITPIVVLLCLAGLVAPILVDARQSLWLRIIGIVVDVHLRQLYSDPGERMRLLQSLLSAQGCRISTDAIGGISHKFTVSGAAISEFSNRKSTHSLESGGPDLAESVSGIAKRMFARSRSVGFPKGHVVPARLLILA